MEPIIKNTVAIIVGRTIGSLLYMFISMISGFINPPPDGAGITTTEGLKVRMHLFQPKHFVFPF